jgi:integrase
MRGKKPFRANTLVANHLGVAAAAARITGAVGWQTFQRSISTWLIDNDENVNVTQELSRHAQCKTALDPYAKAVTHYKRRAHTHIVDELLTASMNAGTPVEWAVS